jgi:pSer/pThr/pTyr-binding forkhead associated (FHA) protein
MSAAPALMPSAETKWTVLNGAMAGSVRLMKMPAFTIGRSPECEFIIIEDPKCSRRHAEVRWTANGCEIVSVADANPVIVNGREVSAALLNDDDVVAVGNTELRFNSTSVSLARRDESPAATRYTVMPRADVPTRPQKIKVKRNPRTLVIYAVVGIAVLYLFTLPSAKKKAELTLRTESQIQADIDAANKMNEAAQNSPNHHVERSITARQAQENFVRGFRDYRKGQFERALDGFQACLALDPSHPLCNRYMRLAQRRFNELVQYNIVLGRRYRDQAQYQACRSAFRNVMVMVKDAAAPAYREAKANYDACNSLSEDRF